MPEPSDLVGRPLFDIPQLEADDELADFLIKLRKRAFPSQPQTALYAGIHRTTIGRYEAGVITPRSGYAAWLAKAIIACVRDEDRITAGRQELLREVNNALPNLLKQALS